MKHQYKRAGLSAGLRGLALAALLGCSVGTAQAQLYTATNVVNHAGTYADLGATGTALVTPNFDDANAPAAPIGFPFTFNGTAFTDFVLNTNGYLKLGTVAPVTPYFPTFAQEPYTDGPLVSATEANLVLPFNADLEAGTGATEYRVATTGTAPSRVCTIQWKNVSDKARPASATSGTLDKQFANFSFQVKLYEGSNSIDFVYGTATPSANTTNANFIVVGIKGADASAAQVITAIKPSNNAWSTTVFQQGPYTANTNGHNIRATPSVTGGTPLPDPGRTYGFILPMATDAAAQLVYGYNKLAVPAGQPATIQALVRNAGTAALSNVAATLSVTGANTYTSPATTLASLAAGATAVVTFAGVAVPNVGKNTVTLTVVVAGDNNAANNSTSMLMVTNSSTFSFVTPGGASSGVVFSAGPNSYYAAKITLTAPRDITAVRAYLSDAGNTAQSKTSVGETVYAVVVDAASGAILGRSASYVVKAADINVQHTFALTAPVSVPAGDVLIGMAQTPSTGPQPYYPFFTQTEDPTRPNTFYFGSVTTPAAPAPALTSPNNQFKLPFEAETATPSACAAPTAVTITGTSTTAAVAFSGPANGTGYQLVYGPPGFSPATGGTTTPTFAGAPGAVTGLAPSTCYDFYVRSLCGATDQSALVGPFSFCTPCTPPVISTYPYVQNFDVVTTGQALPCGITITDANADGFTWQARGTVPTSLSTTSVARSAPNAMVYLYNNNDATVGANDWFYTPALAMTTGQRYRVSFYYRVASTYTERLEVKYGPAASPTGQTTPIFTNNAITNTTYALANTTSTPVVLDITPATGTYYVGFHAISNGDQGFLAVDDLTIAATPLATSEALNRAVSVFPNPSASGVFNLEIHGANARQDLGVEVTNMLGQRVYTGTARDNVRSDLNLSSLAPGIYSLKVRNGEEYTLQQLAIVK
ncbi:MAG: hypothetical protein NVSMB30_04640 [Hymenobacter sp.]